MSKHAAEAAEAEAKQQLAKREGMLQFVENEVRLSSGPRLDPLAPHPSPFLPLPRLSPLPNHALTHPHT